MTRWDKKGRSAGSEELSSEAGRTKLPFDRRIGAAAAALVIVSFGIVRGPQVIDFFFPEDKEAAHLEVAEPAVSNPKYGESRAIDQEAAQDPTVAVTLRNLGSTTAWIEEARITIVEAARLAVCVNQGGGTGDVPRTHDYRIALPEFPGETRRVVRRDLHVQVLPGEGVRPVLSFKKGQILPTNLYAIAVEFVADPGSPTYDAGRFVIGVPGTVERSGLTLPESEAVLISDGITPGEAIPTWCFRHNLAAMRRVIAEPGDRSAEIRALDHVQLAPGWSAYADHSPAHLVVEELLGSEDPEAVLYAIEAARRSGNLRLEAAVRRRAIAILLDEGSQAMESYPPNAVASAERVLSLGPSSVASRLLWRARAAASAEDAFVVAE